MDRRELESMHRRARIKDLVEAIVQKNYTFDDLRNNLNKMEEVADFVNARLMKEKEEIEIFVALFGHLGIYPKNTQICFVLEDDFDPRKTAIKTLEELKASIKENALTDFGVMSGDGLRQFQLKQYKDELNTDGLFDFIKKKIEHYGKDLGQTNLLIILQGVGEDIGTIDFEILTKRLNEMGMKPGFEILVSYNEANKVDVINRVYPSLATCRMEREVLILNGPAKAFRE